MNEQIRYLRHCHFWLVANTLPLQGVKQGGLLSADLYKLYVNDLLIMLKDSDLGIKIGSLTLNAVACRVGKMPAFMSKVHATGVYWHFPE